MRNITKKAINAFIMQTDFKLSNTQVDVDSNHTFLLLHGNVIARKSNNWPFAIEITTAGWNTTTTKERLNGLPGVRLHTKAYQLYLNDKPWDGSWTVVDATTPT